MTPGALPNLVIIGAMKCGTTALHRLLSGHPQIAMSVPKELNYFFGPASAAAATGRWTDGNWWRGPDWYADHFPAATPVRGESSPGYTSPDHPEVAGRMAAVIPDARLVYLVRDPVARALSQYRHHQRDGTEHRPAAVALVDPHSQYLARSRYHERLEPFLAHFPSDRILVVAQEDLRDAGDRTVRRVVGFAGADPTACRPVTRSRDRGRAPGAIDDGLRAHLERALRDDAARLRAATGRSLPHWSV